MLAVLALALLLRLRERTDAAGLTGEGIELAMEYEHEARRWGVDPDLSRDELHHSVFVLGKGWV